MDDDRSLPVIGPPAGDEPAACGPKVYVSREESVLLAAMRDVREEAIALRRELADVSGGPEREHLERRIDELRGRWDELAGRREAAYRRKMIMLGHLPPDVEWPAP